MDKEVSTYEGECIGITIKSINGDYGFIYTENGKDTELNQN